MGHFIVMAFEETIRTFISMRILVQQKLCLCELPSESAQDLIIHNYVLNFQSRFVFARNLSDPSHVIQVIFVNSTNYTNLRVTASLKRPLQILFVPKGYRHSISNRNEAGKRSLKSIYLVGPQVFKSSRMKRELSLFQIVAFSSEPIVLESHS